MVLSVPGLLLIAAALLAGCAPLSPTGSPTASPASPRTPTAEPGSPSWRSADDLVDAGSRSPVVPSPDSDYRLDGSDTLAPRLAARCAEEGATGGSEDAFIRELVADLYADGVDPGVASEAMIRSRCGEAQRIVAELIAQGGDTAVSPVVERAAAAQGAVSVDALEQAAQDGLRRWSRATGIETARMSAPLAGADQSYAMIYFPLGGRGDPVGPSSSLAGLFGSGLPGYGIYTFILFGDLGAGVEPANIDTYSELLRVIETYVLAADGGGSVGGANRQAHSFLVPVHAERSGASLLERTGPELSAGMRGDFAAYLRAGGQDDLAQRLDRGSGPFLVSSLEPRLVPATADPQAPRMLVDLSEIGPEYMYSVVDAYDRPIPVEQVGRVESLAEIRARLIDMFPDAVIDASAAAPPAGGWVYLFGRRQDAKVLPPVSKPPVSKPGLLASVPDTARDGRDGGVAVTR